MRNLKKNKQKMWYSNFEEGVPVYETDDDGNVIYYTDSDGNKYPLDSGITETAYTTPVEFRANISTVMSESQLEAFGVDQKAIYSQIVCLKGYLPLKVGSLIWLRNPIKYEDAKQTKPLKSSADFTVKGVLLEALTEDRFLLQRNSSEVTYDSV